MIYIRSARKLASLCKLASLFFKSLGGSIFSMFLRCCFKSIRLRDSHASGLPAIHVFQDPILPHQIQWGTVLLLGKPIYMELTATYPPDMPLSPLF